MLFWKKKPKRSATAKPKTKIGSSNVTPKPEQKQAIPAQESKVPPHKTKPKADYKRKNPETEFLTTFRRLCYKQTSWEVWKDFIVMTACSISNSVDKSHYKEREALYMRIIQKYKKQEQALFPELFAQTVMALEENPEQDFLGKIVMELELTDEGKKQIFTPYSVSQCMAGITLNDLEKRIKKDGYVTLNDPCCGAGSTLIASIHEAKRQLIKRGLNFQNHVLVIGQDIETTVALMCYIQISLLGMAGYIKIDDAITEPISSKDTLENYWFTPMYFSDVWVMRRAFHKMDDLMKGEK